MASLQPHRQSPSTESPASRLARSPNFVFTPRKHAAGLSRSPWKPSAFRLVTLITATLICWALIAILQILLARSQKDGGIILAATIDDIPFAQSFLYRYLPTIVALVFSIFWSWIDLQIKRVEPYYQLSRSDGAWGKDSLLLSYPSDFLPFVPLGAFKNRHWAVFWASISIVCTTYGVVPLQAGIFATETISRTSSAVFSNSVDFIPASKQPTIITGRYVHSAHGIIWLNETLPPYMTRDYVLAPFELQEPGDSVTPNQTWTADTMLYSLDLQCETPTIKFEDTVRLHPKTNQTETVQTSTLVSSDGCEYPGMYTERYGNETIGPQPGYPNGSIFGVKMFSSNYIGRYGTDNSDYYLGGYCPETVHHTFLVLHTRNKKSVNDAPQNVTSLYCAPFYYQQEVTAIIDASTRSPLNITAKSDKQPLPAEKWNVTFFEYQMYGGRNYEQGRDALPLMYFPDQLETVSTMPLGLNSIGFSLINSMVGFAVGATQYSLEELLDPEALGSAYETTYRILFARSMVEILDQDFTNTKTTNGSTKRVVAAVVVVPVFTYIVQGLLGFISLCSIALSVISVRRKWNLHSDPSTIANIMALVSDNPALLEEFAKLDRASIEYFEKSLRDKKFQLEYNERGNVIAEADNFDPLDHNAHGIVHTSSDESLSAKPVRPSAFRSFVILPFVSLQIALAIVLGVLLLKSRPYGIARPSNEAFVRQLVENYIPTALATFIEPVWILINRLMCMLQPLEELRGGKATAQKSINANYSSLPPQIVIFKALRLLHFKLAAICTMALLANILAVSFSGMFEERSVTVPLTVSLHPPYQPKFVPINGTVGPNLSWDTLNLKPSGAYTGGKGLNQFLVANSNYTAGTPLPAWTDKQLSFVPFADNELLRSRGAERLEARTMAFGANLECQKIESQDWTANWYHDYLHYSNVSVTMDGITCEGKRLQAEVGPLDTYVGAGTTYRQCQSGRVAMEFVLVLGARQNASAAEQDFCAKSIFFGYFRDDDVCSRETPTLFDETKAMFMGCRSKLVAGEANVLVDNDGRVHDVSQLEVSSELSSTFLKEHFSNDASNMLQQANNYLLQGPGPSQWHNDSFATGFMNYFMLHHGNDSRFLDPDLPLPSFDDVTRLLYPVYTKLFAIWLGINKEKLLIPRDGGSTFSIEGLANQRQTRIFLSMPLFIVAEAILGIYTIVGICIYLWRPGRFLPRMPTSIGAVIALFAASEAVRDMSGTSLFTSRERKKHLKSLGRTYGYGKFVGTDGKCHEGIEKEPLVDAVPLPGIVEKVQAGFSQKGLVFKRGHD